MLLNVLKDMGESGRPCRIEIDPAIIHHQREGIVIVDSEPYGAQEAVFKRDIGKVMFCRIITGFISRRFVAPADNSIYFI